MHLYIVTLTGKLVCASVECISEREKYRLKRNCGQQQKLRDGETNISEFAIIYTAIF